MPEHQGRRREGKGEASAGRRRGAASLPKIRPTGVSRPVARRREFSDTAASDDQDQTTDPAGSLPDALDPRERFMSLGEHLEELRWRLLAVISLTVVGTVVASVFIYPIHDWIVQPYLEVTGAGRTQALTLILRQVPGPVVSLLKLAAMVTVTLTFPISTSILWGFVSPAVSRRVAWAGHAAVFASSILFWMGVYLCWKFIFPLALRFMLVQLLPSGVSPQLTLEDYYSFVFFLHVGAGAGFQLPLVVVLLGALGILTTRWHARAWRYVVVSIFVFAAVVTPPDPITQTVLAVPLLVLYLGSVGLVWFLERTRRGSDGRDRQLSHPND